MTSLCVYAPYKESLTQTLVPCMNQLRPLLRIPAPRRWCSGLANPVYKARLASRAPQQRHLHAYVTPSTQTRKSLPRNMAARDLSHQVDPSKFTTDADGAFKRRPSSFRNFIQKGGEFPPEKGERTSIPYTRQERMPTRNPYFRPLPSLRLVRMS